MLQAMEHPDRCTLSGLQMFTAVASQMAGFLGAEEKQQLVDALNGVLEYLRAAYQASPDFTAFEEDGGGEERGGGGGGGGGGNTQSSATAYMTLMAVLQSCFEAATAANENDPSILGYQVIELQEELALRLLKSKHFTRQLAAVKELQSIFSNAEKIEAFRRSRSSRVKKGEGEDVGVVMIVDDKEEGDDDKGTGVMKQSNGNEEEQAGAAGAGAGDEDGDNDDDTTKEIDLFMDWICSQEIINQILRTNLHQPQYAEAVRRFLVPVVRQSVQHHSPLAILTPDHFRFLLELIEDSTTFEDIKNNVCAILGALTPHLDANTQRQMLERVVSWARPSNLNTSHDTPPATAPATAIHANTTTTATTTITPAPPPPPGVGGGLGPKANDASSSLGLAFRLLDSICRNDEDGNMPMQVLSTICSIVLSTNACEEAASTPLLVDACLRYDQHKVAPPTAAEYHSLCSSSNIGSYSYEDESAFLQASDGTIVVIIGDKQYLQFPTWIHFILRKIFVALKTGQGSVPAAHQLHLILEHAVPAVYATGDLFYKDVNKNACMARAVGQSFNAFLDSQREKCSNGIQTSCPHSHPRPPPIGILSHSRAVDIFCTTFKSIVYKGTYFCSLDNLQRILEWATSKAILPTDATSAWTLLFSLVSDTNEITGDAALKFLNSSMCAVDPRHISWTAWRVITAYMAFCVKDKPDDVLSVSHVSEAADFSVLVRLKKDVEWGPWAVALRTIVLHCPHPEVSYHASLLLSRLVAYDARLLLSKEEYKKLLFEDVEFWVGQLKGAASPLFRSLPTSWQQDQDQDQDSLDPSTATRAMQTAQRTMLYLHSAVEHGHARAMPSHYGHDQSYAESSQCVDVVYFFNNRNIKISVTLPRNSYVGTLRQAVATHIGLDPCSTRLLCNGKEYSDDSVPLNRVVAMVGGKNPVMQSTMSVMPSPAWWVRGEERRALNEASPSLKLASTEGIYSVVLALEQLSCEGGGVNGGVNGGERMETATAAVRMCARLLLGVLPTSRVILADVVRWLSSRGGDEVRRVLVGSGGRAGCFQERILALGGYVAETLAELVLPAREVSLNGIGDDSDTNGGGEELYSTSTTTPTPAELQSMLFPSGVLPTLLELAMTVPVSDGTVKMHTALLLVSSSVAASLAAKESSATATDVDADTDTSVYETALMLCRYAVTLLESAMLPSRSNSNPPTTPPPSSASIAQFLGGSQSTTLFNSIQQHNRTDDVIKQALQVLSSCTSAAPEVVAALFGMTSANANANASAANKNTLAPVLLGLLAHSSAELRKTTAAWIEEMSSVDDSDDDDDDDGNGKPDTAAPPASITRQWVFEHIITPLLLASKTNKSQSHLIKTFLEELTPPEAVTARLVLDQLIQQLCDTAVAGTGPPVSIVETVTMLMWVLESFSVEQQYGVVEKLMRYCLFPELVPVVDSSAPDGGGGAGQQGEKKESTRKRKEDDSSQSRGLAARVTTPPTTPTPTTTSLLLPDYPRVIRSACQSLDTRCAYFDLIYEIITHDRAAFDSCMPLLLRYLKTAAETLPNPIRNEPLVSLRPERSLCGLKNGGATCYMNATFQQLFMQPTVRSLLLQAPPPPPEERNDSVFYQVQTMFSYLMAGVSTFYEPSGFWKAFKDYEGQPVNIREHQDAYEFFTRLQDTVDEYLRGQGHPRAIHAALGGSFAQIITVAGHPDLRSEREEEFYQVSLDVRGKRNLLESLDSYVAVEMMNGENQWLCEALGKKVDAEKRTLIKTLPHTLMLHLKRFEWDYETFTRIKVKDRFEFPLTLNMKPYTVEGALQPSSSPAPSSGGGPGWEGNGTTTADNGTAKVDAYYQYELRGIVVHSGSAFAGHYYSYIKDRETGVWHCFDDVSIDRWDVKTMEEECFGGRYRPENSAQEYDRPNSAYMLVYERVGLGENGGEGKCMHPPTFSASSGSALISPGPGANQALNAFQNETIARYNIAEISKYHIVAPDLSHFISRMASILKTTVLSQLKARKVPRFSILKKHAAAAATTTTGVAEEEEDPSLLRLAAARQGEEDVHELLASVTTLCLFYIFNIVSRGSHALVTEVSNRKPNTIFVCVNQAAKTNVAVASAVVSCMTAPPLSLPRAVFVEENGYIRSLNSCFSTIRQFTEKLAPNAVWQLKNYYDGHAALQGAVVPMYTHTPLHMHTGSQDAAAVVQRLLYQLDTLYASILKAIITHKQQLRNVEKMESLFQTVQNLSDALPFLPPRHTPEIARVVGLVVDMYWEIAQDGRDTYVGLIRTAVTTFAGVCRQFTHVDHSVPVAMAVNGVVLNPYCLVTLPGGGGGGGDGDGDMEEDEDMEVVATPSPPPPIPEDLWNILFDCQDSLIKFLVPGCFCSREPFGEFLKWMWHNNHAENGFIIASFLKRLEVSWIEAEQEDWLAAEVGVFVDLFAMDDDVMEERYRGLLHGVPGKIIGEVDRRRKRRMPGLLDLSVEVFQQDECSCSGMMLLFIIVSMFTNNPIIWQDAVSKRDEGSDGDDDNAGDVGDGDVAVTNIADWILWAFKHVGEFSLQHSRSVKLSKRWEELTNCHNAGGAGGGNGQELEALPLFDVQALAEAMLTMAREYNIDQELYPHYEALYGVGLGFANPELGGGGGISGGGSAAGWYGNTGIAGGDENDEGPYYEVGGGFVGDDGEEEQRRGGEREEGHEAASQEGSERGGAQQQQQNYFGLSLPLTVGAANQQQQGNEEDVVVVVDDEENQQHGGGGGGGGSSGGGDVDIQAGGVDIQEEEKVAEIDLEDTSHENGTAGGG